MLGLTFQSWGSEGPFAEVLVVLGVVAKRVLESNLMVGTTFWRAISKVNAAVRTKHGTFGKQSTEPSTISVWFA